AVFPDLGLIGPVPRCQPCFCFKISVVGPSTHGGAGRNKQKNKRQKQKEKTLALVVTTARLHAQLFSFKVSLFYFYLFIVLETFLRFTGRESHLTDQVFQICHIMLDEIVLDPLPDFKLALGLTKLAVPMET